jgi:hypothetical protein
MPYTFEDLGEWERYTPDPLPAYALGLSMPVLFARRLSDGVDWYDFARGLGDFTPGTALATTIRDPATGQEIAMGLFRDPSLVFPAGLRLLEVSGLDPDDPAPWKSFEQQGYDPTKKALVPRAKLPVVSIAASQALIQLSRMPHDGSVVAGAPNLAIATEKLVAASGDYELQTWFSRAQRWVVNNPNVQKIGAAFNLSPEDIQAAFEAANLIEE